ncbi:MAG TPA: YdeI/OmpD-associated family protein [Candidatus Polarisedimenticolaceae bacterium]|nr:YdeI/OmpD-associated family protein [Candidatus Polarisedimenticolaceae bacterium]
MARKDPRIDTYIKNAAPFAKPILVRVRKIVHGACPDVVETLKWSNPAFEHHGLLAGFAVFKAHCTFGFWKDALLRSREGAKAVQVLDALGKMTSIDDFPSDTAVAKLVRAAAEMNEKGIKVDKPKAAPKPPVEVPADLAAALGKNKKAKATFDDFSPSNRREYVEWIVEAKQDATRQRRLAQAIEWMAEGKVRMWKYVR